MCFFVNFAFIQIIVKRKQVLKKNCMYVCMYVYSVVSKGRGGRGRHIRYTQHRWENAEFLAFVKTTLYIID